MPVNKGAEAPSAYLRLVLHANQARHFALRRLEGPQGRQHRSFVLCMNQRGTKPFNHPTFPMVSSNLEKKKALPNRMLYQAAAASSVLPFSNMISMRLVCGGSEARTVVTMGSSLVSCQLRLTLTPSILPCADCHWSTSILRRVGSGRLFMKCGQGTRLWPHGLRCSSH
jgi:hypothetical protein